MKSFKRILVLALAVVMCLTAFAISSSAAGEFNPEVKLLARYNETGDKIIVTVTTDKVCGALMGTLTFPEGAALEIQLTDSKFIEDVDSADNSSFYTKTASTVTFAVVADNVDEGSTTWADIYFDVATITDGTTLSFGLEEIQVCSVGEELAEGITVSDAKVEIPFVSLRALGAKKQVDANTILFGSRVDLSGDYKVETKIVVDGKEYVAASCGYAYGYTDRVEGASEDFAEFNVELNSNGEVVPVSSDVSQYVLVKQCKKYKYWNEEEGYFVYTLKVSKISDSSREVSVRPYTVYKAEDGSKQLIQGNVISRSCDGIDSAPAFLGVTSNELW